MRFEYPAGVLPEERPIVEQFERDIVPYVEKNGSEIGERAMQGDHDAFVVIQKYHHFINGMPHMRAVNLKACISALKRWISKRQQ